MTYSIDYICSAVYIKYLMIKYLMIIYIKSTIKSIITDTFNYYHG